MFNSTQNKNWLSDTETANIQGLSDLKADNTHIIILRYTFVSSEPPNPAKLSFKQNNAFVKVKKLGMLVQIFNLTDFRSLGSEMTSHMHKIKSFSQFYNKRYSLNCR